MRLNDVVAPFAAGRPFPWRLEGGAPRFTGPMRMPENPLLPQPWSLHAGE